MTTNKLQLLGLKAKICGYQHVSHRLRNRINRLEGDRRHAGQLTKRELGTHTRSHLLAYGFLRGIPYRQIERHHGEGNAPDPQRILEIARDGLYTWQQRDLTVENVRAWLDAGGDEK